MTNELLIRITTDPASDAWGFVGVVLVGDVEAYRTLEAFPTPGEAAEATQRLVGGVLGELLAGREWRAVRDARGGSPRRADFNFSALRPRQREAPASSRPTGTGQGPSEER